MTCRHQTDVTAARPPSEDVPRQRRAERHDELLARRQSVLTSFSAAVKWQERI